MVIKLSRRPSQKQHLLETAIDVVAKQGVAALTIENLAVTAGITKGGVQYHFETKDKFVTELLEFLLSAFDEAITATAGKDATAQNWLRAYVETSLSGLGAGDHVGAALIASLPPGDPRAAPYSLFNAIWQERSERGIEDKALAHIIRMACDSIWIEQIYSAQPSTNIDTLRNRLLKLIDTLQ